MAAAQVSHPTRTVFDRFSIDIGGLSLDHHLRQVLAGRGNFFFCVRFSSLAFAFMMPACGLKLPLWVGVVVFFIVHLGDRGAQHAGECRFLSVLPTLGLTLFGVDKATAAGFSIVVFLALTIPLWIIGFIALTVSGMNLKRVRLEISGLKLRKTPDSTGQTTCTFFK